MKFLKLINGFLVIFSSINFFSSSVFSQSFGIQKRAAGYLIGGQFTFDFYKPFASAYINLERFSEPMIIQSGGEREIYAKLGSQLYLPKFILFQATLYQLSALSSYLETDLPTTYHRFDTVYNLNVLRALGGSFEEPYSFSLFLGNITFLGYSAKDEGKQKKLKQSGSALAGFLVSIGNHQICDNIYLRDRWYQYELMLVGKLDEKYVRRISWNFRIGFKQNNIDLFHNVILLAIERSHSTWQKSRFSLLKNSIFAYKTYTPISYGDNPPVLIYHHLSYGKKLPVDLFNKKIFFILGGGVKWEWTYLYDRLANTFTSKPSGNLTWLIQPNIEF